MTKVIINGIVLLFVVSCGDSGNYKANPEKTNSNGDSITAEEAMTLAKVHMEERKIDMEKFKDPETHKVKDLWVVTFPRKPGPPTLFQGDYYKVYVNAMSGEIEKTLTNE